MKVAPIFKDPVHQEKFDREGYLTLQFLSQEEIKQLLEIYSELHPDSSFERFYSSSYSGDFKYKKDVSDRVTEIFKPNFERIFKDYFAFGSAFLVKPPTNESELAIHQDWTIVDEEKFVAINCWVPLIDINETNGGLQVVPGSHYSNFKSMRAPTMPFFFTGHDELAIEAAQQLLVKAGEAVILNQSLVHFSPPNHSDKVRIAITSGIKSKGAPMIFHYKDNQSSKEEIDVYKMEENFLINFDNFFEDIFKPPVNGKKIESKSYAIKMYEKSEVKNILQNMRNAANGIPFTMAVKREKSDTGFLQKLKSLFQPRSN